MYRLASDMPNPLLLALIEELYMQQERIQPQSPLFRMLAGVCKTTDDVLLSYLEPSHSLTSNESEPTEIPNIQAQS